MHIVSLGPAVDVDARRVRRPRRRPAPPPAPARRPRTGPPPRPPRRPTFTHLNGNLRRGLDPGLRAARDSPDSAHRGVSAARGRTSPSRLPRAPGRSGAAHDKDKVKGSETPAARPPAPRRRHRRRPIHGPPDPSTSLRSEEWVQTRSPLSLWRSVDGTGRVGPRPSREAHVPRWLGPPPKPRHGWSRPSRRPTPAAGALSDEREGPDSSRGRPGPGRVDGPPAPTRPWGVPTWRPRTASCVFSRGNGGGAVTFKNEGN